MANPLKGEVSFTADGKDYTLLLDINALCVVEERLGLATVLDLKFGADMKLGMLRAVFWAALLDSHPDMTEKEAGRLMNVVGAQGARGLAIEALTRSFPTDTDRPPEAAAGTQNLDGTGDASTASGASST